MLRLASSVGPNALAPARRSLPWCEERYQPALAQLVRAVTRLTVASEMGRRSSFCQYIFLIYAIVDGDASCISSPVAPIP